MGIAYNPRIATDGLVLALDAGNPKSYPGSGTTWTDLNGQGNNGTLLNGVGYSGNDGGSLVFDGVDDYVNLSSEIILTPPWSSITVFKIATSTATSAFRTTPFGHTSTSRPGWNRVFNDISGTTARVRFLTRIQNSAGTWTQLNNYIGPNGSSYVNFALQDAYWVNNILYITTTVSESKVYKFYINGELIETTDRSASGDLNNGFRCNKIGSYSTVTDIINGNIYKSLVYNRELSTDEVLQDFNATRGRLSL